MLYHIAIFTVLLLLLPLTFYWFKTTATGRIQAWTSMTALFGIALLSALAPSLESPYLELLSALIIITAGLGGSAPAAYFVGHLKDEHETTTGAEQSTEQNTHQQSTQQTGQKLTGTLGNYKLEAQLTKTQPPQGATGGGKLIGIFERVAVALAFLTGQVTVIAVIVAIKGLARYPEIRSGHLMAEKFIVGTLVSLLWAAGCALTVLNMH